MSPQMGATSGRRLVKRALLLAVLVVAVLVAVVYLMSQTLERESGPRPDVVLGSGSFDGRDWIFGYNVDEPSFEGRVCFQLVIDGSTSGCGTTTSPVRPMRYHTGSGGDPRGLLTAELFVSDEVARVSCGTGTDPIGETHFFEMPPNEPRPVLCLATESQVAGREWFAFAFDEGGRQIAKSDGLPQH
jgi:hypothetical protein